jgi:DNA-binding response OmpR family regulator
VKIKKKPYGVIVVEENQHIATFVRLILENSGYRVSVVGDTEAAGKTEGFDADIAAVSWAALRNNDESIRKLRQALACPILVYGHVMYEDSENRNTGADGYIETFYEPEHFLHAIESTIHKNGSSSCSN